MLGFWLPLAFSVALAGVVAAHLLRRRPPRIVVPSLEAFLAASGRPRGAFLGRRWARVWPLLLRLLVLALLFASALPDRVLTGKRPRKVAFVVDVSASMAEPILEATGQSRMQAAQAAVVAWVKSLTEDDQALVVRAGSSADIVVPWTGERERLISSVERLSPEPGSAALNAALDVARAQAATSAVVFSDGAVPPISDSVSIVRYMPSAQPKSGGFNLGVIGLAARRSPADPSTLRASWRACNRSAAPVSARFQVSEVDPATGRSVTLDEMRALIAPGCGTQFESADLSGGFGGITVSVAPEARAGKDPLPLDDFARATVVPLPRLRILLVGEPSLFLRAFLLTEPLWEVTEMGEAGAGPTQTGPFDLAIVSDATRLDGFRARSALFLGRLAEDGPWRLGAPVKDVGFDRWKTGARALRYFDPYQIQVSRGRVLVAEPGDVVLGASSRGPLLVAGERAGLRVAAFGFEPEKSDLVLRSAYPLLLRGLIEELVGLDAGGVALSVPVLEQVALGVSADRRVALTGPYPERGARFVSVAESVDGPRAWFADPGFYRLDAGPAPSRWIAAAFAAEAESLTRAAAQLRRASGGEIRAEASLPEPYRPVRFWLLGAALLTLLSLYGLERRDTSL